MKAAGQGHKWLLAGEDVTPELLLPTLSHWQLQVLLRAVSTDLRVPMSSAVFLPSGSSLDLQIHSFS